MTEILRVYPNPWHATDRDGLPCAIVPTDPEGDGGGPGQFVGARVSRKHTEVLQKLEEHDNLRSARQRTRYEYLGTPSADPELAQKLFACEPVEIPRTKYYRQRLREGALFAADEATARAGKVRFIPAADLAKRFAPRVTELVGTLEQGGAPLALGTKLGDFDAPKGDERSLPEEPEDPTFDAPSPKGKGSKSKTSDPERA